MLWGQRMRALMGMALKRSGLSRPQLADRLSSLLNESISLHQINAWLAETKTGHRFPAEYLPAFCAATGSLELLRDAVELLGGRMATKEDLHYAEIGRTYVRRRQASKREKALLDLVESREA